MGSKFGFHSGVLKVKIKEVTIDAANCPGDQVTEQDFTIDGIGPNDAVIVNGPADLTIGFTALVKAKDTLQLVFTNPQAGAIDPASGIYKIIVLKKG